MSARKWNEALAAFKQEENPEVVLMVAGQAELMRIVIAWENVAVTRLRCMSNLNGQHEDEIWSWLWENTRFDRAALLRRIPNSNARTGKNLDALIACRVLYPDGTINAFVRRYLKQRVFRLFSPLMRRKDRSVA